MSSSNLERVCERCGRVWRPRRAEHRLCLGCYAAVSGAQPWVGHPRWRALGPGLWGEWWWWAVVVAVGLVAAVVVALGG